MHFKTHLCVIKGRRRKKERSSERKQKESRGVHNSCRSACWQKKKRVDFILEFERNAIQSSTTPFPRSVGFRFACVSSLQLFSVVFFYLVNLFIVWELFVTGNHNGWVELAVFTLLSWLSSVAPSEHRRCRAVFFLLEWLCRVQYNGCT